MIKEEWHFNSGCSWHMTRNEHILTNLQHSNKDIVIFGDGARGRVIGTGSLVIPRLSKLKNVLLVEGLAMNEELLVQFTKDKCIVRNQSHCHIMEGERSSDNCYLITNTSPCMNEIQ